MNNDKPMKDLIKENVKSLYYLCNPYIVIVCPI